MITTTLTERREVRLDPQEVQRFFPADISELFGLSEDDVHFFGIASEKENVEEGISLVNKSYSLYFLVNECKRPELADLNFQKSRSKWIRLEHYTFEDVRRNNYTILGGMYPLLYVYITNWNQTPEHSFRFAELLRYADHEQYRKRGIASAVLESVCKRMKEEGTEYLYVNYYWSSWPKSSHVVPAPFIDDTTRGEILSCFPKEYDRNSDDDRHVDAFTSNFTLFTPSFFKFIDKKRNEKEHKKAMKRYEECCREYDKQEKAKKN